MATTFDGMIDGLREIFSVEHVSVEQVRKLLGAYKSKPADWQKYAMFDPHRYTRNLVDVGNGHYNIMILCWGPGMGSSVHDHANAHCFVKMLSGQLTETQFAWPKNAYRDHNGLMQVGEDDEPLEETNVNTYEQDGVTYINDSIGLHRMENKSHTTPAISLHVYIPAFKKCRTFDSRTGKKQMVRFTFWSINGERVIRHGKTETNTKQKQIEPNKDKKEDFIAN